MIIIVVLRLCDYSVVLVEFCLYVYIISYYYIILYYVIL